MRKSDRSTYNQYMRLYLKRRFDERTAIAITLLGGKCVHCGTTDRMEFDHIDPRTKTFEITDKIAQYAWWRIIEELKKCQLLCFKCHVEKGKFDTDAGLHPQAFRRLNRSSGA